MNNQVAETSSISAHTNMNSQWMDNGFKIVTEFCRSNPRIAKIMGGSALLGVSVSAGIGGVLLLKSAY